jgi:hypothetical protein
MLDERENQSSGADQASGQETAQPPVDDLPPIETQVLERGAGVGDLQKRDGK